MPEGGLLALVEEATCVAVDVEARRVAVPAGGDVGPDAGGNRAAGVDRVLDLAEGEVAARDEELAAAAVAHHHHVLAVAGLDPGLHRVAAASGRGCC